MLHVEKCDSDEWVALVKEWREKYPLKYDKIKGGLTMQVLDELDVNLIVKLLFQQMLVSIKCGVLNSVNYKRQELVEFWWCWHNGFGFPAAITQFGRPTTSLYQFQVMVVFK